MEEEDDEIDTRQLRSHTLVLYFDEVHCNLCYTMSTDHINTALHLRAYISTQEIRITHHMMGRLLFFLTVLCFCRTISGDKSYAMYSNNGIYYYYNYNYTDYNADDSHIKESDQYNERFVDMFLFHCLNFTLHLQLMDYNASVVSVRHGSGLVAVHRCFHVLYMQYKQFENKTGFNEVPFDDVFKPIDKTLLHGHSTLEFLEPQNDMNDSVEQTTCQVDYGSISRMPSISMCFIHHENSTKDSRLHDGAIVHCDAKSHDVIPVSSNLVCSLIQHATIIAHFKAAWLLAKINYGLVITSTFCVLLPTLRSTLIRQRMRNSHSVILFGVLNALWMVWRFQETLQWDTKWQHGVPYMCVATNTTRYLVEGAALFLFACTSLERYRAITGSLLSSLSRKKVQFLVVLVVVLGMITGGICSIMNIVALSIMTSPPALLLKTCSIPNNVPGNLILLIIAKVLSGDHVPASVWYHVWS